MIGTVTQTSSQKTWRPRFERIGLAAVVTGLALVKLGQKLLEKK